MKYIRQLPGADELRQQIPLSQKDADRRIARIREIEKILSGVDRRKLLIIGPCSADNETAVLDYMTRLAKLRERVEDAFLIVPRLYTGKPRTNGLGYKGLLHHPELSMPEDNIYEGIIATRKLHQRVIRETGLFCADELLYPEVFSYIDDLAVYVAVGARSVENQQHRLLASGLDIPVGMKNPQSGDISGMINAIIAAQHPQQFMFRGWECESEGNPYVHGILRGYSPFAGVNHTNYHFEELREIHDLYVKQELRNMAVVVDCNHGNSGKHYDEQIRISKEVVRLCRELPEINAFVKGLMIESYLQDGAQKIGENLYGKSVTDPCLGWEKSEALVNDLAALLG